MSFSALSRRGLMAGAGAALTLGAACAHQGDANADPTRDRLVLLGTMGGPVASGTRAMASQAVVVGGAPYLIDCGVGAVGRLAGAGIQPRDLAAIFITHLHDDHMGELPALLMVAWASGLAHPIDIYGPAPLAQMVAGFLQAFEPSIAHRMQEFPRPHPTTLIRVHEIAADGEVLRNDALSVSAVTVEHGDMRPAFGYRITTPQRIVAISGDTSAVPAVQRLAQNADILVAEAMYMPALQRQLQNLPAGARMEALLRAIHMTAAEAGQVAAQAQVDTLVLSHLIPGDDPSVTDAQWIAEASTHFHGRIVVGRDLMEL